MRKGFSILTFLRAASNLISIRNWHMLAVHSALADPFSMGQQEAGHANTGESDDFIGFWNNVVLNNLKAFQRILFLLQNGCQPKQHHMPCVHVLFPASFSFGHHRLVPERFFRAPLKSLWGRSLLPPCLIEVIAIWLLFQVVFLPLPSLFLTPLM